MTTSPAGPGGLKSRGTAVPDPANTPMPRQTTLAHQFRISSWCSGKSHLPTGSFLVTQAVNHRQRATATEALLSSPTRHDLPLCASYSYHLLVFLFIRWKTRSRPQCPPLVFQRRKRSSSRDGGRSRPSRLRSNCPRVERTTHSMMVLRLRQVSRTSCFDCSCASGLSF